MRMVIWLFAWIVGLGLLADITSADDGNQPAKGDQKTMAKRPAADIALTDADRGKTIKATVGKSISLTLDANATTGFEWQLQKLDGDSVVKDGEPTYRPKKHAPGIVGSGGASVFRFTTPKPGKTTVTLVYVRPWEHDVPPAKTFEMNVVVSPK